MYLFSQIHQEHTFRQASARRTAAESGQEYPTSEREYIEPHKTQGHVLSLWSGSTNSQALGYQRTNPREYQVVRTQTNKTT